MCRRLQLSNNGLSGNLPIVVASTELLELNLHNNLLTGSIPTAWSTLRRLRCAVLARGVLAVRACCCHPCC
jgi:hypothetical protein